jgi:hypothetical protein
MFQVGVAAKRRPRIPSGTLVSSWGAHCSGPPRRRQPAAPSYSTMCQYRLLNRTIVGALQFIAGASNVAPRNPL